MMMLEEESSEEESESESDDDGDGDEKEVVDATAVTKPKKVGKKAAAEVV